jgi:hypothetical protein
MNRTGQEILKRQEAPEQLERLRAQRWLYRKAKGIAFWQFIVAAFVPAALVLPLEHPEVPSYAVVAVVAVAGLAAELLLDQHRRHLRGLAARIQEAFDCDVLDLPWRAGLAGAERPDSAVVKPLAEALQAAASQPLGQKLTEGLAPWYSPKVQALALERARIECQRENCDWDFALRRRYGRWLLTVAIAPAAVILGIALVKDTALDTPLHAPAMLGRLLVILGFPAIWAWREWIAHGESIERLHQIDKAVAVAWEASQGGHRTPEELRQMARDIQDRLLLNRMQSPEVMDWLYNWLRPAQQKAADSAAAARAAEGHAASASSPATDRKPGSDAP